MTIKYDLSKYNIGLIEILYKHLLQYMLKLLYQASFILKY